MKNTHTQPACEPFWHESRFNLNRLGRYLVEHRDYDANELIRYFEEPWKWQPEWDEMVKDQDEA